MYVRACVCVCVYSCSERAKRLMQTYMCNVDMDTYITIFQFLELHVLTKTQRMSRPYHQILMMLLAMIIIEAERTVMFSSQMCSSSFVSRMAPRVTMPRRPPDVLSPEGRTKYFMCSDDSMENETKDNHISKKVAAFISRS